MPKPGRTTMFGRVSGYADEASAFLRRRRLTRRPFARVRTAEGTITAYSPDTEAGRELFLAAAHVVDAAR
jgi:hypothetical protein